MRRPERHAWQAMNRRCYNPKCPDYQDYGARGITVCERWRDSFENFLADMGPRPSSKHSIDRIDVNGNYEPSNCRWATLKEQLRNQRRNPRYEFRGERLTLTDIAERSGIPRLTLHYRLKRGWNLEDAATRPVGFSRYHRTVA